MACNYKQVFNTVPNGHNAYRAEFNKCVEERLYKIDPYKHFDDRTIASHVRNTNTLTVYWNDIADNTLEKPSTELDLTRTGINKRVAEKLAEIEDERKAVLGRKDNIFLFVMLPNFANWDGSKIETNEDKDIFFKWEPFKKDVPCEVKCLGQKKQEPFIVMPKCKATRRPLEDPTFFETNYC